MKLRLSIFTVLMLNAACIFGQVNQSVTHINLKHGSHREGKRTDSIMAKWRGYGLGEFIHWGLYSIPGGEYNGKTFNSAAEFIRTWKEMPTSYYDSLIYKFNPKKYSPVDWAKMAKQMGARYVTITTKHHDGFCLWPSKYTKFTVANSPYKKDLIGPLVKAYNAEGIDVILYFSIMDWHSTDWRFDIKNESDSLAFEKFKTFTRNQLLELLKLYPTAKGLWFDGTWDKAWVKQAAFADELETEMRKLHPGIIIGSRFRADEFGKRHFDSNNVMMGDYEQGWERKIPNKIEDIHGNDWDCVMTIPENQWGYCKTWRGHIKTLLELIEMNAKCVSLGGNFVLNFGPKADGTFRQEEINLATGIGNWMKINNEAIYNCGYAAGWDKQDWGYFTKKTGEDKIYMIVFNKPISGNLRIKTPTKTMITKAYKLGDINKVYAKEAIVGTESFIQLGKESFDKPIVIVLETKIGTDTTIQYEKAKT